MNNSTLKLIIAEYKKYLPYGAIALLMVWFTAFLTVAFLPGPYRLDFFGVVAERTENGSSASIESTAIIAALIIFPLVMAIVERYKKH
jgi:hypothetical protein